MLSLKEKIEVMQAHLDGKEIETLGYQNKWVRAENPSFNWELYEYRVKKQPREFWIVGEASLNRSSTGGTFFASDSEILAKQRWPDFKLIKVREVIE